MLNHLAPNKEKQMHQPTNHIKSKFSAHRRIKMARQAFPACAPALPDDWLNAMLRTIYSWHNR
jgi:hypothetical protein